MGRFARLLKRLDLDEHGPDCFHGGAGEGGIGGEDRLFGGLVAAQAVMAACRTESEFPIHSLHAYFLRPGRAAQDIRFEVQRTKDGRNFRSRIVEAWQEDECIFQLMASFQRPEAGPHHQPEMSQVPGPDTLPNRDQLRGRSYWQDMPIDVRMATDITADEARPAEQASWLRVNGDLPEDPAVHAAMIAYASDRSLLDTAYRPHADQGRMTGASLDHAMWFHQPPRFDDWLLYTMTSPVAANSRGLAFGSMFSRTGDCRVTVAQEGLQRIA